MINWLRKKLSVLSPHEAAAVKELVREEAQRRKYAEFEVCFANLANAISAGIRHSVDRASYRHYATSDNKVMRKSSDDAVRVGELVATALMIARPYYESNPEVFKEWFDNYQQPTFMDSAKTAWAGNERKRASYENDKANT